MKYAQIKQIINETKPCPDGLSIPSCASCVADLLAQVEANKCWYCKDARITRKVKLYFGNVSITREGGHDLVHLLCLNCAIALNGERCTFIMLDEQI